MTRLTDPDQLGQGTVDSAVVITNFAVTGADVTISSSADLPVLSTGEYFEIRNANTAENNGLYFATGTPTNSSLAATKVAGDGGANPIADATGQTIEILYTDQVSPATGSDMKSVYFDWYNREIWLLKQGGSTDALSNDGVTLQALYSFTKEEWRLDDELIKHPFPFTAITPEQFELIDGWVFHKGVAGAGTVQNVETVKLIRTGGWREIDTSNVLQREYAGVITLGDFENNVTDTAYFEQGDDPATADLTDFEFAGPVNEAIETYIYQPADVGTISIATNNAITRGTGSWITDGYKLGGQITIVASDTAGDLGTYVIEGLSATELTVAGTPLTDTGTNTAFAAAVNNRNVLNVRIRVRDNADDFGSTFGDSNLPAIGVTELDNKVFRFPLSSTTDLDVDEVDAVITAGGNVYEDILVRFFDGTFSQEIAAGITSDFSIVIDVGTFSGIDAVTNGTTSVTTADAGIPASDFDGGTLVIHEGNGAGSYAVTSATGGTITLTSGTPTADTGASFTLYKSVQSTATLRNIYEKIQYLLRQDVDINSHSGGADVVGKKSDALLRFVGTELESGQALPENPNNLVVDGVAILGFRTTDKNDVAFFDDTETKRTFPFIAAGTINFNQNLVDDFNNNPQDGTQPAKFWVFFDYTVRTTGTDIDFSSPSGRSITIGGSSLSVLGSGGGSPGDILDQEFIRISGASNAENNGLYRATDITGLSASPFSFVAYKVFGDSPVAEAAGASVNIDQNPIDSPSALLVQDDSSTDITGTINSASTTFDFDFDGNVQGGRTAGTVANIRIRAIGDQDAQYVELSSTIEQSTSNSYTLVAAKERNYST
jgi:hypothetical protein